MKGDTKVIQFLNKALGNELVAINQYFLHSRMLEDWGLKKLAEKEYEESIDEMKHADQLTQRILFLDGPRLPELPNKLRETSETLPETRFECRATLESSPEPHSLFSDHKTTKMEEIRHSTRSPNSPMFLGFFHFGL